MPAAAALPSRLVRHNQPLDYVGLHEKAREAYDRAEAKGLKQYELANRLGKTGAAISRALKEPNSRYASLQAAIIAALTDFDVEDERKEVVVFRLKKRDGKG